MHRSQIHSRQRGFTFVELMMGIVVTSIVLCALSVFVFGVGENWESSDTAQSAFLASSMGVNRLNMIVRGAQLIDSNPTPGSLDNSTAPAACMLWTDSYQADGNIQYCEMTLLKYDQTNQRLLQYAIAQTAGNAATVQSGGLPSAATFLNYPNVAWTPVVNNVSACQILVPTPSTGSRPSLEIILQMSTSNGNSKTLVYTTATVRAPA